MMPGVSEAMLDAVPDRVKEDIDSSALRVLAPFYIDLGSIERLYKRIPKLPRVHIPEVMDAKTPGGVRAQTAYNDTLQNILSTCRATRAKSALEPVSPTTKF